MPDQDRNPGRKWRENQNKNEEEVNDKNFKYTPYTTDIGFFSDPKIYETEVTRSTQEEPQNRNTDSPSGPRKDHRSDMSIKTEIGQLLAGYEKLADREIQVDVHDGVVTLSGNVDSPYEQQTAESVVRNVIGVLDVKNDLKINQK